MQSKNSKVKIKKSAVRKAISMFILFPILTFDFLILNL